jgi:alpha-beta hydrolase superfamily lysophospholipase
MIGTVSRMRTVTDAMPAEMDSRDGVAYSLWLPDKGRPVRGGVVILHGAGSCKESHHDYARVVLAAGFASIAFDQRGHGASPGPMDGRVLDDTAAMAELLRERTGAPGLPLAVRGSSMGGYLAVVCAEPIRARAVVAICPASGGGLRRALAAGALQFEADAPALDALFAAHDLQAAIADLDAPILLLHAEGDEQVPVQHSRELAQHLGHPGSRLITVPGGHHRSIQHDAELQAVSLRFIEKALR